MTRHNRANSRTLFYCAECIPASDFGTEREWRDHIRRFHPQTHIQQQAARFRLRPKLPRDDDRFDEELF